MAFACHTILKKSLFIDYQLLKQNLPKNNFSQTPFFFIENDFLSEK